MSRCALALLLSVLLVTFAMTSKGNVIRKGRRGMLSLLLTQVSTTTIATATIGLTNIVRKKEAIPKHVQGLSSLSSSSTSSLSRRCQSRPSVPCFIPAQPPQPGRNQASRRQSISPRSVSSSAGRSSLYRYMRSSKMSAVAHWTGFDDQSPSTHSQRVKGLATNKGKASSGSFTNWGPRLIAISYVFYQSL